MLTMANLPSDDRVLKRSPERYITIYALTEPDTGEIRYVGKTEKPPAVRLREHSKLPVNDDMRYWIRGLEARGTGPKMETITCCGAQWWEGVPTPRRKSIQPRPGRNLPRRAREAQPDRAREELHRPEILWAGVGLRQRRGEEKEKTSYREISQAQQEGTEGGKVSRSFGFSDAANPEALCNAAHIGASR